MKTVPRKKERPFSSGSVRFAALTILFVGGLPAQTPTLYTALSGDQRWEYYWHETYLSPGIYLAAQE
jgi:hypothetical protein